MSQPAGISPPYSSKDEFIASGLEDMVLETELDCSICREPLATSITTATTPTTAQSPVPRIDNISLPRVTNPHNANTRYDDLENQARTINPSQQVTNSFGLLLGDGLIPEPAVRIRHCTHIFGSACLLTWFATNNTSNRCPQCNQVLFPARRLHLALREPTRGMRLDFALVVENMLGDAETAVLIRRKLMSEWTRALMRELAIEVHRAQGFEVTYEYLDGAGLDGEEEEEEEEEVDGGEYEEEREGKTDVEDDAEGEDGDGEGERASC